jgi:hypothetical protein
VRAGDGERAEAARPHAGHAVVRVAEQVADGVRRGEVQDAEEHVGDERRADVRRDGRAPERPGTGRRDEQHGGRDEHRELRPRVAVHHEAAQGQQPEPPRDEIRRAEGELGHEIAVRDRGEAREEGDRRGDGEVADEGEVGESEAAAHDRIVPHAAQGGPRRGLRDRWGSLVLSA